MAKQSRMLPTVCGVLLGLIVPTVTLADPFDGTYTGKRVLTGGDSNASCPTSEDVSVTIKNGTLTFTDSALKNFAMGFDPMPDGSFDKIDTESGGTVVTIRGRIADNTLDADVVNGPCRHHWHLEKQ